MVLNETQHRSARTNIMSVILRGMILLTKQITQESHKTELDLR